jgi:hypothetical protein
MGLITCATILSFLLQFLAASIVHYEWPPYRDAHGLGRIRTQTQPKTHAHLYLLTYWRCNACSRGVHMAIIVLGLAYGH